MVTKFAQEKEKEEVIIIIETTHGGDNELPSLECDQEIRSEAGKSDNTVIILGDNLIGKL